MERGINLPDVSIMQELCKLLNITLNELFSGENSIIKKTFKILNNFNFFLEWPIL